MKFEEALHNFNREIAEEYGITKGLVKIAITPELMGRVTTDCFELASSRYRVDLRSYGEFMMFGIQIIPREKDNF